MPAVTPWFAGAQVPVPPFLLTDTNGNPVNAAGGLSKITCVVYQPDGTMVSLTSAVTSPATGTYAAVFTAAQAGHHVVVWTSTDTTYPGAFSDSFEVQPAIDTTIVSLAEAKEILHQTATTKYDAKIQGHNASVTNWIEWYCGPVIVQPVVEELPSDGLVVQLSKPPVIGLTAWTALPAGIDPSRVVPAPPTPMFPVRVFGVPYPLTQLYADPKKGTVKHTSGLPFYYGDYLWSYQAGRPVIPACIYEAAKITLKHLYYVESGGTGSGTGSGDEETTMTPFGFAVPNRAIEMLAPEAIPAAIA